MRVILQPCASKEAQTNYRNTIKTQVALANYDVQLAPIAQKLAVIYPSGQASVWGITAGNNDVNAKKWRQIECGDKVLFSANNTIFAVAIITLKLHSKDFAQRLWGSDENGNSWEYVYFISELKRASISYADFNKAIGFAPNNIIRGFSILSETKSDLAASFLEG